MNPALLGPLCALLSSLTWALGTSGYSSLARDHSPVSVNLVRSSIALPFFLTLALGSAMIHAGGWRGAIHAFDGLGESQFAWLTISILASYALGDSLFMLSTREIGVPAALTIASAYPLLTAAWAAAARSETLRIAQVGGLLITVVGVCAVILSAPVTGAAGRDAGSRKLRGVLLAGGCAVCWALNSIAVARGGQGIPTAVGNTIRMSLAVILCLVIGKLLAPKASIFLPAREIRKWLWVFVVEAFAGSFFFLYGLAHSPLAIGATLSSVAPVLSVPISLAMGLESFSWKRTASVFVVVLGIWLLVGS